MSVFDVDPFREPERLLNVPWLAPFYWRSTYFVAQYVISSLLPGLVPVSTLDFPEWDLKFIIYTRYVVLLSSEFYRGPELILSASFICSYVGPLLVIPFRIASGWTHGLTYRI